MNKLRLSNLIGILSILIGVFWLMEALQPVLRHFFDEKKSMNDAYFALIIYPMIAIPGILAILYGTRLLNNKTKHNIKGALGALSIFGVLYATTAILRMFRMSAQGELSDPNFFNIPTMLLLSLAVIPLYVALSKLVMKQENLIPTKGEFVGKGIVGMLAILVWLTTSVLFEAIAPNVKGIPYLKKPPWDMLGSIEPILLAIVFYMITLRLIRVTQGGLISKGIVGIFSIQIWITITALVSVIAPVCKEYPDMKEPGWIILGFFVAILFAAVFYRAGIRYIQQEPSMSFLVKNGSNTPTAESM